MTWMDYAIEELIMPEEVRRRLTMWESTYEVPLVVDADIPMQGTDLAQINEMAKRHLNEGASNGYMMVSFEDGVLVMMCNSCHMVNTGSAGRCTIHSYMRR